MYRKEFYKLLEKKLKNMKRHHKIFRFLKKELLKKGYWKNHKRGKDIREINEY
jgi:hypothetical protein